LNPIPSDPKRGGVPRPLITNPPAGGLKLDGRPEVDFVKAAKLFAIMLLAATVAFLFGPARGEEPPATGEAGETDELITRDQFIDMLRIRAPKSDYPEKRLRSMDNETPPPAQVTVNILFKVGSTEPAGDFSIRQIQEAGEALSSDALAGHRFEIAGHTDNTGSKEENLKLSRERAEAVKEFLVDFYGISPDRLVARGYGETQPVASNETEDGRAMNRRVVFTRLDEYK
jgi:outer membrane protein OmpA-like peptidoglycan-associated protein